MSCRYADQSKTKRVIGAFFSVSQVSGISVHVSAGRCPSSLSLVARPPEFNSPQSRYSTTHTGSVMAYTAVDEIPGIVAGLRETYKSGVTR